MISARESSLFLFHALGKILYSKRALVVRTPTDAAGWGENPDEDEKDSHDEPNPIEPELRLQRHLSHFKRKPSKVQVNVRLN